MVVKNAYVYTAEHKFKRLDLWINGEKISGLQEPGLAVEHEEILDAEGLYAIPGLVDIHFHGAVGYDFCHASGEQLQKIAEYEAFHGILAICPATMSYSEEILGDIADKVYGYQGKSGADLIGIHMEGPFISKKKAGAQNPQYILPIDGEMFSRLQKRSGGLIKIVDIAPELSGAMDFIEAYHSSVCISLAHTDCDYETAWQAFDRGARHITHLYNAMPGINHRKPGPVIAAWEAGADLELIADGIHVHPAMVRLAFQMAGAEKIILISDSMEAAGLSDGTYHLGGQAVTVEGKKAVITEKPDVIAGSVSNLYECMKNCVMDMGIPMEQAVLAATENPARAIGMEREYGRIAEGNYGNLILTDRECKVHGIIQRGRRIR